MYPYSAGPHLLALCQLNKRLRGSKAVGWELWERRTHKARAAGTLDAELWAMSRADLHTLSVPGLGLTMADGGEKVEPSEAESSEKKPRRK